MANSGIQGLDNQAAGAYARADALAVPVRPVSPGQSRPKFDLGDLGQVARPPVRPERVEAKDNPAADAKAFPQAAAPARNPAGTGGFSAFLAQSIAQDDGNAVPPQSAFLAGSRAYARQSGQPAAAAAPTAEILTPFPRLASGRALDLSV